MDDWGNSFFDEHYKRQAADTIERLQRELADVKEALHYCNGCAELAIKHRDKAERELDKARAELRNVDRLRGVRVIQHDGVYLDSTEVVVDIDDDPPHNQWHGSGRTVREALWRACRGKDRAAIGGEAE